LSSNGLLIFAFFGAERKKSENLGFFTPNDTGFRASFDR
jgi:hypothetical protein